MPRQNGLKGSPHTTNQKWRDGYEATFGKKEEEEVSCHRCWTKYTGDCCPACEGKTGSVVTAIRFGNSVKPGGWDMDSTNKPCPGGK